MFNYELIGRRHGYAHNLFIVKKTSGEWPSDRELIKMMDNGEAPFGGHVNLCTEDVAEVNVYTD